MYVFMNVLFNRWTVELSLTVPNLSRCWAVLFRFHPYAPHLMVQTLFILFFFCRVPNPDSVLAIHTPSGVFSPRSLLENRKGCFRGSRLSSLKKTELLESPSLESNEFEPLSAAKCRIFKRLRSKVTCGVELHVYNLLFH